MASILRVKARWTGFSGAPGYTVLHFRDFGTGDGGADDPTEAQAVAAAARARNFFEAIKAQLPTIARVQIEQDVEVIESTTGELVTLFNAGTLAATAGTGAGSYTAVAGAVVNWRTNAIRNGRRLRGRTFLVPLSGVAYGADGSLSSVARTAIQTAATALADSTGTPDLIVYGRPTSRGASDGAFAVVASATVPALSAVLRSRRD